MERELLVAYQQPACTRCVLLSNQSPTPCSAWLQVPKDGKVLVACQKGLRSLAACEQLSRAGYNDVAWLNGGFDNSTAGAPLTPCCTCVFLSVVAGGSKAQLRGLPGWPVAKRRR